MPDVFSAFLEILGSTGTLLVFVLGIILAWRTDLIRSIFTREDTARLIRIELTTMRRHYRDNIRKLSSMKQIESFGTSVDMEKFKYSKDNFLTITPDQSRHVDAALSITLFRLSLFQRNTQFHVAHAMKEIYGEDGRAKIKYEDGRKIIELLTKRMARTKWICEALLVVAEEYEKDHAISIDIGELIPKEFFQLEDDKNGLDDEAIEKYCRALEPNLPDTPDSDTIQKFITKRKSVIGQVAGKWNKAVVLFSGIFGRL